MRRLLLLAGSTLAFGTAVAGAQSAAVAAPTEGSVRPPGAVRGAGPGGATMRCRDGSHPAANAPTSACEGKGGVLLRYPVLRTPAAPAAGDGVVRAPEVPRPAASPRPASVVAPRTTDRAAPPPDATQLCRDGTAIRADTSATACADHGGQALRFRKRRD